MCHHGEPVGSFSRWTCFHFLVLICYECGDRKYPPIFIHELVYEWLHSICGDSWRCKMLARRILPLNAIYKGSHMQPRNRGQGKPWSSEGSRHCFICTKPKKKLLGRKLNSFSLFREILQETFQEKSKAFSADCLVNVINGGVFVCTQLIIPSSLSKLGSSVLHSLWCPGKLLKTCTASSALSRRKNTDFPPSAGRQDVCWAWHQLTRTIENHVHSPKREFIPFPGGCCPYAVTPVRTPSSAKNSPFGFAYAGYLVKIVMIFKSFYFDGKTN